MAALRKEKDDPVALVAFLLGLAIIIVPSVSLHLVAAVKGFSLSL